MAESFIIPVFWLIPRMRYTSLDEVPKNTLPLPETKSPGNVVFIDYVQRVTEWDKPLYLKVQVLLLRLDWQ